MSMDQSCRVSDIIFVIVLLWDVALILALLNAMQQVCIFSSWSDRLYYLIQKNKWDFFVFLIMELLAMLITESATLTCAIILYIFSVNLNIQFFQCSVFLFFPFHRMLLYLLLYQLVTIFSCLECSNGFLFADIFIFCNVAVLTLVQASEVYLHNSSFLLSVVRLPAHM